MLFVGSLSKTTLPLPSIGMAQCERASNHALSSDSETEARFKLYPFTRSRIEEAPAMVVIDPGLSAGRPVIAGTGLATEVIAERYKAGESIDELARDYERKEEEIEEAVRCLIQFRYLWIETSANTSSPMRCERPTTL